MNNKINFEEVRKATVYITNKLQKEIDINSKDATLNSQRKAEDDKLRMQGVNQLFQWIATQKNNKTNL